MQIGGGIYKSRKLFQPPGLLTRPTSIKLRLAVFNIAQNNIEGARFLDLFAGVGAMGLEAISRGAISCTFIENDPVAFKLIKKNANSLNCESQCRFLFGDVLKNVQKELKPQSFDLIYADPPYGLKTEKGERFYSEKLIESVLSQNLLQKNGDFFLEEGMDNLRFPDEFELRSLRRFGKSFLYQFNLKAL